MRHEEISTEQEWEAILASSGLPEEIPSEREKARQAGVEVVPLESISAEYKAISKKLREEDPRNVFGGFPASFDIVVSLVATLKQELEAQKIQDSKIKLFIHSSCVNGNDCITLSDGKEKIYHYNTKRIRGYSRERMISYLKSKGISCSEK